MGKTLPLHKSLLPTAFGTCTLKSAKQLSGVTMKDTCRTTMKYLVNAGTWHSNMLPREAYLLLLALFLLDQKQSHHVNWAVFSPVPGSSHCSSRRKTLHIQTAGKGSSCYICSYLTVLQYLWIPTASTSLYHQGKKKYNTSLYVSCN